MVIVAAAATAGLLSPWGARMIDLDVYRAGAQALLDGRDPYSVADPATGLPFTYPPFAALLFIPFAVVPLVVARAAITVLSLAALVLVCHLTLRHARPVPGAAAPPTGRPTDPARPGLAVTAWVALAAAVSHPVLDTLLFGQVNLILVALVLGDIFLIQGRWRGVAVGIAAGIKLTPGLFIVYYLVTGQRREARNAMLSAAATVLVGLLLRPEAAWAFFTRYMLDPARTGNVTYAGNQSILATTARLLREPHPSGVLTLALSIAVIVFALVLARGLHRSGQRLAAVCVVAVAALLASPISWTHHWVWFIPCLGVLAAGAGSARWHWAALAMAVVVLWSGPMRFMPKNDLKELHQNPAQQLVTNSFALLAVAFLGWAGWCLWRARRGARAGEPTPEAAKTPTVA